jgi:hypothetical protein
MDLRQIQIEQGDVRFQFEYHPEGGGPIGTDGDYIKISPMGTESRERFTHQRERFRDENSNVVYGFHVPPASCLNEPGKRALTI